MLQLVHGLVLLYCMPITGSDWKWLEHFVFLCLVQGSAQLYVTVADVHDIGSGLVTVFNTTLTAAPGNNFTDTGYLTGTRIGTILQLKYRVLCLEDYFGPSCCQGTDSTNCTIGKTMHSPYQLPRSIIL